MSVCAYVRQCVRCVHVWVSVCACFRYVCMLASVCVGVVEVEWAVLRGRAGRARAGARLGGWAGMFV